MIEPAQWCRLIGCCGYDHAGLAELRDQRGLRWCVAITSRFSKRLCCAVQRIDIIACLVKPVTHGLPRHPRFGARGHDLLDHLQPCLGVAHCRVQGNDAVGNLRPFLGEAGNGLR